MRHSRDTSDKKTLFIGGLLILAVGAYFISKHYLLSGEDTDIPSSVQEKADQNEVVPRINSDVLLQKIQGGEDVALLDIRDAASFRAEHLPHSLSVPIGTLEDFSPVTNETVVIIFTENDPATFETAKNTMRRKSFPYFFLRGGFEGWKASGAPIISLGDPNAFIDQSKVIYITLEDYKKLAEENNPSVFLLDVQTEDNFKKKHLKGAKNIPLAFLEKRVKEIPVARQIIVYGENELASFQGGTYLFDLGIFSARTIKGNSHLTPESGLTIEP